MATCLNRVFSQAQMAAGAWRIPFLIGGAFGFIAMRLRLWLKETPVFEEMQRRAALSRELPLGAVLKGHGRAIAASILSTWMLTAAIVVVILMTPALMPKLFGLASAQVQTANLAATAALMCLSRGYWRCYRSIRASPGCCTDTAALDRFSIWTLSWCRDDALRAAAILCAGRIRRWRMCPHTHHDDSRLSRIDTVQRGLILLQPRLCAVRWVDPIAGVMAGAS